MRRQVGAVAQNNKMAHKMAGQIRAMSTRPQDEKGPELAHRTQGACRSVGNDANRPERAPSGVGDIVEQIRIGKTGWHLSA